MLISMIVARSENHVIGSKGAIPWRLPADLAYFKKITMGHSVLMGRKTFESIGKPLPGRENLVVSKNNNFNAPGCKVFGSVLEAIDYASTMGETELFVIGGGEIYKSVFPVANKLYVTEVQVVVDGDTFFQIESPDDWALLSDERHLADEKNNCNCRFTVWERRH